ncbi:hypothetical protein PTKIN_Ptkin17bG0127500 [Pterospermum kingtungense]
MALRSSGSRKLSFEMLSRSSSLEEGDRSLFYRSSSDPVQSQNGVASSSRNSRKKKKKKDRKKKEATPEFSITPEDPVVKQRVSSGGGGSDPVESNSENYGIKDNGNVNRISYVGGGSVVVVENVSGFGELRQRNVSGVVGGGGEEMATVAGRADEDGVEVSSSKEPLQGPPQPVANGNFVNKLKAAESLDWKRLMAEDPHYLHTMEKSPVKYFLEEMYSGNSLRSTTTFGSEKERERVYDTIFRLPWRCEALISVGFFVCFDSFLSLVTIMPTRILITLWRLLTTRQFKRPSAAELCDFGCFAVLTFGVILLELTDISLIYHMIRGQGTIKLYVVYNVLEIFDKLCQSFGGDAITLSTCIVAHNNALFALLVSNNFAEIKSSVFKRFSKDNIHSLVYSDSVERFHITAFLIFVLAQNILEAEGPWFESFLFNALLVFFCEMLIDIIKHSFLAKFNGIKPIAYSEFLEDLCKQTLNIQDEDSKKNLTFVPLAPACVVIRVLTPVYAAQLRYSPLPWRFFWILLLISMTYLMLTSLKVMIGMGLRKHATCSGVQLLAWVNLNLLNLSTFHEFQQLCSSLNLES